MKSVNSALGASGGARMARSYRQAARADSADQTREEILNALEARLRAQPALPLSVDLVAKDAGVARSTVYSVFGSKAGLFEAFVTQLYARAGLDRLAEAVRVRDARLHLRAGIRAASELFAADLTVFRTLFAMSALDEQSVGGALAAMEENRRGGMEHLVTRLAEDGVLRKNVPRSQAVTILWMLCSFEAFDRVYQECGQDVAATAELLSEVAERAVCADGRN